MESESNLRPPKRPSPARREVADVAALPVVENHLDVPCRADESGDVYRYARPSYRFPRV
jgi:hypothetical protein